MKANNNSFNKIYSNISKNLRQKKWKCIIDDCNDNAINSHLLQQNGILNNIAQNNHLIEIKIDDLGNQIRFSSVGIREALSLSLFCHKHDSLIFKSIETLPLELNRYDSQLLFSYRVVCAEIRKKEHNIELYNRILNSVTLFNLVNEKSLKISIAGNKRGISDLLKYKVLIENEIKEPSNEFVFEVLTYPIIKVYSSAVFSPFLTEYTTIQAETFCNVFIHTIPYNNNLNIIIGYSKSYVNSYIIEYIDSWKNLNIGELSNKLTNLFATKIENWGLSPEIYYRMNITTRNRFLQYFYDNASNHSIFQTVDFNLFENEGFDI